MVRSVRQKGRGQHTAIKVEWNGGTPKDKKEILNLFYNGHFLPRGHCQHIFSHLLWLVDKTEARVLYIGVQEVEHMYSFVQLGPTLFYTHPLADTDQWFCALHKFRFCIIHEVICSLFTHLFAIMTTWRTMNYNLLLET
jgi:hypothetical protein